MLLFLFIPFIQWKFKVISIEELRGDFVKKKKPNFTAENWFSGKYQDSTTMWYNEDFGFRNTCVRLKNQIDFTVFNIPTAKQVIEGKDGYYFEE